MENWWNILDGYSGVSDINAWTVGLSFLLSFVLSQVLAWVYYFTHNSLSYSKSFVQSLIIISLIISLVMQIISGSFVIAVGLMGALSLIRFRNIIKDTRDITFLFSSLVIGMACGSGRFALAITGSTGLYLVLLYLHFADFGMNQSSNAFLHFNYPGPFDSSHELMKVFSKFCKGYTLVSSNPEGMEGGIHYSYQLTLRASISNEDLLSELSRVDGIRNIGLTVQEQLLEM